MLSEKNHPKLRVNDVPALLTGIISRSMQYAISMAIYLENWVRQVLDPVQVIVRNQYEELLICGLYVSFNLAYSVQELK